SATRRSRRWPARWRRPGGRWWACCWTAGRTPSSSPRSCGCAPQPVQVAPSKRPTRTGRTYDSPLVGPGDDELAAGAEAFEVSGEHVLDVAERLLVGGLRHQ